MTGVRVKLRLAEIINELGITQTEFAERVGLSRQTVNNLLHDPGRISFVTLEKLVEFGINFDEIFEVENSKDS